MKSDGVLFEGCFPVYPVPKGSVRASGRAFYLPKKTKEYMARVAYLGRSIYKGAPLEIPVSIDITFAFPKEGYRLKPKHSNTWVAQKPDLDNLEKSFIDALTGILWKDDCLVVEKKSSKVWHDTFGIWLRVSSLI